MIRLVIAVIILKALVHAVNYKRTVIRVQDKYVKGDQMFIRGGYTEGKRVGCNGAAKIENMCAIPIRSIAQTKLQKFPKYNSWVKGDKFLDFYGQESLQGTYGAKKEKPLGSPMVFHRFGNGTVGNNSTKSNRTEGYWIAEFEMDCERTMNPAEPWFEFRAYKKSASGPIVGESLNLENHGCTDKATGVTYLPNWYAHNHWGWCGRTTTVTFNVHNSTDCIYT